MYVSVSLCVSVYLCLYTGNITAQWTEDRSLAHMSSTSLEHHPAAITTAASSYSAGGYDSTICCSKMSCDAFPSEALYEADKVLEKFAAVPRECVFTGWRMERMVNRRCMFYVVILRNMSINSLHLCLHLRCRLLHCCFAANR